MLRLVLTLVALVVAASSAVAHESRPTYLEIREIETGRYDVLWKRPARGDRALGLSIVWPEHCRDAAPGSAHVVPGAMVERRLVNCGPSGLLEQRIAVDGLSQTRTDALVRVEFLDGAVQTNLVKPASPWIEVEGSRPALAVATEYFALGVEHILLGLDHLLFVLGLTLIVRGPALLVKTITAFTIAHSLTLAAATLGLVAVPQAPVEAVVALSIVFLASELARLNRGALGLTARSPWLVAFAFGLLHGFGFAGALAEVGLPQSDIPLALLTFNLGVEAGQLAFVAAVLAFAWMTRHAFSSPLRSLTPVPAYAIGSLAVFWLIERVASFG